MKFKKEMKIPPNLDLPPPSFPIGEELVAEALRSAAPATPTSFLPEKHVELFNRMTKALLAITNQTWRMSVPLVDRDTSEPKTELTEQELKKITKAYDIIQEIIKSLGIEVKDRTGEAFNDGLPDQIITEEPQEGITEERIIRTIRPTIIWEQTMVQRGEIDLAVPMTKP